MSGMFFMAKSALCIGVVVALAAGAGGLRDVGSALDRDGRDVAVRLGQACAASRDCIELGSRIASSTVARSGIDPTATLRAGQGQARSTPAGGTPLTADPEVVVPHPATRPGRHAPHAPPPRI